MQFYFTFEYVEFLLGEWVLIWYGKFNFIYLSYNVYAVVIHLFVVVWSFKTLQLRTLKRKSKTVTGVKFDWFTIQK